MIYAKDNGASSKRKPNPTGDGLSKKKRKLNEAEDPKGKNDKMKEPKKSINNPRPGVAE